MELNSGKSPSSIEDYSLITQEKCSPPRAKLFMVSIISFVVATLVVLLVVLTQVEQKTTPSENYSEPDVCPDVAVVGAGLAGTYAAYRLAAMNLSLQIFEMTDRIGGLMYTKQFPNASHVNLELGDAYWVPKLHRQMDAIVETLNLTKISYLPSFEGRDLIYNLRNLNLSPDELNSSKAPYNLDPKEKGKYPYELYRWYLEGDPPEEPKENDTEPVEEPMSIQLDVSLENLLRERASPEGRAFMEAATEPYEMHAAGDAGLFFDYLLSLGDLIYGAVDERVTVKEGMEAVPKMLISGLEDTDRWSAVNRQHRLTKIVSENGIHRLYFTLTQTSAGGTTDTEDTEFTCAKRVILALPPKALQQVKWPPLSTDEALKENLHSVLAVPAMKIYLAYTTPWWRDLLLNPWSSIRTDLPLKRVDVIHEADVNATEELSILMASFSVDDDYDYWNAMVNDQEGEVFGGSYDSQPPVTVKMVDFIQRDLARISGVGISTLPYPVHATYHQWQDYPYGGAWHVWKPGSDWTSISEQMLRPGQDQSIHIVGGAFAPSHLQLSLEGVLQTVDQVIKDYFDPEDPLFDFLTG